MTCGHVPESPAETLDVPFKRQDFPFWTSFPRETGSTEARGTLYGIGEKAVEIERPGDLDLYRPRPLFKGHVGEYCIGQNHGAVDDSLDGGHRLLDRVEQGSQLVLVAGFALGRDDVNTTGLQ